MFLTGLAPNFFVVGLLFADEQRRVGWIGWLAASAPAGIACLIGALVVLLVTFRPERHGEISAETVGRQSHILGPLSRQERIAIAVLAVLVVGLAAQPLLQIDAAWLALGALVIVTAGVLDRERFRSWLDWGFLAFLGVLLGSGAVLQGGGVSR